jgi:secretion/DNA translocation related TadE-like protein
VNRLAGKGARVRRLVVVSRSAGLRGALPSERDRGAGTILVLAVMAVIWLLATTLMIAGGVRATRHRAHSAADSAALGAAERANSGSPDACRIAAAIARDMGALLTVCRLRETGRGGGSELGWIVDVSVSTTFRGPPPIGTLRIPAQARAAPTRDGL